MRCFTTHSSAAARAILSYLNAAAVFLNTFRGSYPAVKLTTIHDKRNRLRGIKPEDVHTRSIPAGQQAWENSQPGLNHSTAIIASNDEEFAKQCDLVVIMSQGKILKQGKPSEVLS